MGWVAVNKVVSAVQMVTIDDPLPEHTPTEGTKRKIRRKMAQKRATLSDRVVMQVITENAIPEGSILSDQTRAAIASGQLALRSIVPGGEMSSMRRRQFTEHYDREVDPIQGTNPHPYAGGRAARRARRSNGA